MRQGASADRLLRGPRKETTRATTAKKNKAHRRRGVQSPFFVRPPPAPPPRPFSSFLFLLLTCATTALTTSFPIEGSTRSSQSVPRLLKMLASLASLGLLRMRSVMLTICKSVFFRFCFRATSGDEEKRVSPRRVFPRPNRVCFERGRDPPVARGTIHNTQTPKAHLWCPSPS